jgi:2-keto-3-deoxy-L-rhamnonate aldolase RhmA
MSRETGRIARFRAGLLDERAMMGTFLKTPSAIVCEVLGLTALDCVCIDAEHAPFGPMEIDACVAALRAGDMPSLVRVRSGTAGEILGVLDAGATGVIVPHVVSGAQAAAAARAARYGGAGGRGYAGSSRAAHYTTKTMSAHLRDSAASTVLIAQIEDEEALTELDAIAVTPGVDCLFVGRMDLTLSMGLEDPLDARVVAAVERICDAGRRHGKPVGMFITPQESCVDWQARGASLFLLGSDHGFLLDGARRLRGRLAPTEC